ncbi:MAG TPA: response regulator, partial [Candidatus Wallbacteria bacterium]|nr:response regulator [Candidatus Wallbacteria bacterium]
MKKILVIEDEIDIRDILNKILSFEGFNVVEADDGISGLNTARRELPDLIICDVMMPGLDGFQLAAELKKEDVTAVIPFIFLSARADRSDVRRGMELGADDYLTKPFTKTALLKAINTRIEKNNTNKK